MMFTEEPGILIALARNPKVAVKRSDLVRDARLINKTILGMDNDMRVTNAAIDSLTAARLVTCKDFQYLLTVAGAKALLSLNRRVWMLGQLLGKTGKLVDNSSEEVIIDLTDEVAQA